jgi:hypothetical protein
VGNIKEEGINMDISGIKEFSNKEEAMAFACERVREHWIVHCYPIGIANTVWMVHWWCF